MNSDLLQEIIDHRGHRLNQTNDNTVTNAVFVEIRKLSPGAENGLLGIDAENDGVTRHLWEQAVVAAEVGTSLVFPEWDGVTQPAPQMPCSYEEAESLVARRVAMAILIINGYVGA